MSNLLNQIATACRPNVYMMAPRKLYTFNPNGTPFTQEEKEKNETVLATSFEECFRKRPDLIRYFIVSVTT